MAWLVRALREAKGSEEGECGGCRRSGSKGRLNDDEQLTIWIAELGMAESEPGMQRVDWVWTRVADVWSLAEESGAAGGASVRRRGWSV